MNKAKRPIPLTLVVPCYNEEDRVDLLYNGIREFAEQWQYPLELIVVDDGSVDNTLALLKEKLRFPQRDDITVHIISQKNTGKGGALRNGVLKATQDFILTLDADMAAAPTELFKWFDLLNWEPDPNTVYIGSREHGDSVITKQNGRKLAGNIFNLMVKLSTPLGSLKDTQCGFKLYPAALAKELFTNLQTYGWAHDVELLYRAKLKDADIVEMPLVWNAVEGSKINLIADSFRMMSELIKIAGKVRKSSK